MKRAVALRHLAFEDLGLLADLLTARRYDVSYREAGVEALADLRLERDDLLIVLGGPISAYDDDRYPFLADEVRLIEWSVRHDVPVLGICLGAQLLARALGARVYRGSAKEIGFAPVTLTAEGQASCPASSNASRARCCIGMATRSAFQQVPSAWLRLTSRPIKPSALAHACLACSSISRRISRASSAG